MTGHGPPITVGVADKQQAALAFAAEEARWSGCDIRVVHAYIVPPSPPQVIVEAYGFDIAGSFSESGQEVLDEATGFLASRYADVTVHPVLEEGAAPAVLARCSATSRLVVLGPDDATPWYSRLFQSRVSRRLMGDAPCPVVVVPDTWSAGQPATTVTLMLDAQTVADGPVRFAFEHAARHHVPLRILQVQAAGSPGDARGWRELHHLLDSWRTACPQVQVDTEPISGAADLPQSFDGTVVLVLGRPREPHVGAALHRSLARAVVQHAGCPVAVVPPDYDL